MKRSRILFGGAWTAVLLSMPVIAADLKQSSLPAGAAPVNTVNAPSIGYVVRPEVPELRAMLGVPGAARFSDPIALPEGTVAAEVAPGLRWVLAIRSQDAVAYLPDSGAVMPLASSGVPASSAFSPSGSRVALYYPDRGEVALVSGLPANPKVDSRFQVPAIDTFVVSDTGSFVYTIENRVLNSDGGLVYETNGPMAFEPGRDALVLFDAASASLLEVVVGSGSTRVIAVGISAPDRLFAGSDRIYAGSSAAGTLSQIEYADGSLVTQNVAVSRIAPSAMTGTMLVGFESDGPAWLVNAQGLSFVPALVKQGVQ